MRYDENADTLEFDWFQNEPSNRNLEDSSQWHSVNEARRVFGRKPVDKFLTRYLSCGIDTVKVQVIFPNIQLFWAFSSPLADLMSDAGYFVPNIYFYCEL